MTRTHAIAIYGTSRYKAKATITYKKNVWIKTRGKHPHKQRYRKTVTSHILKYRKGGQRFTIYGDAKDVSRAARMVHEEGWIPKKMYVDRVSAKGFLLNPKGFARKGKWIDYDEKES